MRVHAFAVRGPGTTMSLRNGYDKLSNKEPEERERALMYPRMNETAYNALSNVQRERTNILLDEIDAIVHDKLFEDQTIGCVDIEKAEQTYRVLLLPSAFAAGVTLVVYFVTFMATGGTPVVLAVVIPAIVILVMSTVMVYPGSEGNYGTLGVLGFLVVSLLMLVPCTVHVFAGTLAFICAPIVIVFTVACSAFSIALLSSGDELGRLQKTEENVLNWARHALSTDLFPKGLMAKPSAYSGLEPRLLAAKERLLPEKLSIS